MSTNYYYHPAPVQPCPTCGHQPEQKPRHIGQSAGGWTFALHIYPEEGINDLADWRTLFAVPGTRILNEFDDVVSTERMLEVITARSWNCPYEHDDHWWVENQATAGPNGLARATLARCHHHGAGTWDCMIGEFS